MSATVADLSFHRRLRQIVEDTEAVLSETERLRERTRLLKEQTDARRARLDAAERDRNTSTGSA